MKHLEMEERAIEPNKHWRAFYNSRVLRYWHLPPDRDVALTIESVSDVTTAFGRDVTQQLMIRFVGAKLPFMLNKTNGMTIEQLYGSLPLQWVGKRIALYLTTTERGGQVVPCIRIRPQRPPGRTRKSMADSPSDPAPDEPALNESAAPPAHEIAPNPEDDGR